MGWKDEVLNQNNKKPEDFLSHRITKQIISPYDLSITPNGASADIIWEYIKNYDLSAERLVLTKDSIPSIEESLIEYKRLEYRAISKRKSTFKNLNHDAKDDDRSVYIYSNYRITKNLYIECKQRLLKELICRIE